MSLLIKALDKAQAEKAQAKDSVAKEQSVKSKKSPKAQGVRKPTSVTADLSLSPAETMPKRNDASPSEVPAALRGSAADASHNKPAQHKTAASAKPASQASGSQAVASPPVREQAANVFAAKRIESSNKAAKLAIIIGAIALVLLAALIYWYQTNINTPDMVIPPKPALSQEMPEPLPEIKTANEEPLYVEPEVVKSEVVESEVLVKQEGAEINPEQETVVEPAKDITEQKMPDSILAANEPATEVADTLTENETVVDSSVIAATNVVPVDVGIASKSASIKVTQQRRASGVDPILMRAYEAYNAGNDHQASADYKQVLIRYGPHVDAMLGLGAIATRQGRLADANGWYRRVLEVEPRNEVAKSGLLSIQQESQPQANESNIKSMLASAPNDANLYAALGDLYANKGQWSAAQQAYFDAYRFNPSAENAFNLGVSLDQLAKPKLALPYYQEALQKAGQSNAIDVEALKARISSIE
ncbi:MAG: tetratricopeptide repeat protein [Methylophilaceae bacterium]